MYLVDAPADQLHSVSAQLITSGVIINARDVILKIGIHGEGDLQRAVGHQGLLNLRLA